MSGKEIRLNQLWRTPDRLFILPMDHGISVGPVQGLEDVGALVNKVGSTVDAVVVHKGLVPRVAHYLGSTGCKLIVHLSASTMLSPDPNRKELVTTVEHAVSVGASAVSIHVNLGNMYEAPMLQDFGKVAEACELWGMPLLAMMYVRSGSGKGEYDTDKIKHAARAAEELGADIVKVNYTGSIDSFREVIQCVRIPVIIAGGPKMASDTEVLSLVSDSLAAGAKGVALGRNIFQHEEPQILAGKIRAILDQFH